MSLDAPPPPARKNTASVRKRSGVFSAAFGRRNEYTTLVSETEYRTAQTRRFLDKIYEGSAKGLVSTLIAGDLLTDGEYEELKKLLENGRERP